MRSRMPVTPKRLLQPGACCSRRVLSVALVSIFWGFEALGQSLDENQRLNVVRASVRENTSSLRSLWIEYNLTYDPDVANPHPVYTPDEQSLKPWGPSEHEWFQQGAKRLQIDHLFNYPYGVINRSWRSIDEKYAYVVSYDGPALDSIRSVYRTTDKSEVASYFENVHPRYMLGREVPESKMMLGELLTSVAKFLRSEVIDGSEHWVFDCGQLDDAGAPTYSLLAWFDTGHDYRLKRLEYHPSGSGQLGEKLRTQGWWQIVSVQEYMSVADAATGKDRWFPQRITFAMPGVRWRIEVTGCKINTMFSAKTFTPKIPDGVRVELGPVADGQSYRSYLSGGRKAVAALMEKRVADAIRLAPPPPPLGTVSYVEAIPPSSTAFWLGWVLLCGCLLGAGLGWKWRRRSV